MNARPISVISTVLLLSFAGVAFAQSPSSSSSAPQKECTVPVVHPVDVRVKILAKPDPKFSKQEREQYHGAEITLRSIFCGTGQVTDVVVTRGLTQKMDAAAIDAAHLIEFRPAEKDGKKVSTAMILKYIVRD